MFRIRAVFKAREGCERLRPPEYESVRHRHGLNIRRQLAAAVKASPWRTVGRAAAAGF